MKKEFFGHTGHSLKRLREYLENVDNERCSLERVFQSSIVNALYVIETKYEVSARNRLDFVSDKVESPTLASEEPIYVVELHDETQFLKVRVFELSKGYYLQASAAFDLRQERENFDFHWQFALV